MGVRETLGAVAGRIRSAFGTVVFLSTPDHPADGGITGDLDPEDWPGTNADGDGADESATDGSAER